MPSAALRRKRSHRLRSSASSESNRWRPWRRAFQSRSRRRLRKCRAAGMMCPTWFSLPTKVSSSDLVAPRALRSRSMSSRQARHLLQGSLSRSRRASASDPKRHSASEGVPSASSFLMEARSSLGSGSLSDAGRPSAWMARRVAADVRSLLSPRSGAAAMRSSMCGSTMPSLLSGRVTIMSRAGANGTSSPSTLGRPKCFCWGLWSSDGSQSEHCRRRALARSAADSDTLHHSLGQGRPPKVSRRDTRAMPSRVVIILTAVLGAKWARRCAALKSTFCRRMGARDACDGRLRCSGSLAGGHGRTPLAGGPPCALCC